MTETTTIFNEPFDPTKEEGTPARSLLPAGKYRAEVIDASISETKTGRGTMLNLTWQILDRGPAENRFVFQSILVRHESPDAQRFGRYKLKDLCDACGIVDAVTDVAVFKHKPCLITVGIERDKEGIYGDKNRVTRIMPAVSVGMPPPVPPPTAAKSNGKTKAADEPFNDEIPF